MNEPASLAFASTAQFASPSHGEMEETDFDGVSVPRPSALDTLDVEGLHPSESDEYVEDQLLRRDLKARLFGADSAVRIGRYDVRSRIGRGGMGTVYVAHDPELDRMVALKLLRPDRRSGQERMLREARALARLSHPNVVTVHEVGTHDDRVFVAMELVRGRTLRQWLEGTPSRTEIYSVFGQAARGLRAAHAAGLVHRDFKPDNVLIGDDGRVRVVDFGVVKPADTEDREAVKLVLAEADGEAVDLTRTGQLLGTPAYMAAEQFLGESIDVRTDVFAFCVTLFEALAGRRPFAGEDASTVCRSVLAGEVRPLEVSDVPAPIRSFLARGLSRDRAERPASLDAIIDALETRLVPAPSQGIRAKRVLGIGTLFGLAAVGGGGMIVMSIFGTAPTPPPVPPVPAVAAVMPDEDPAQDEAFAAIDAATDDAGRRQAAEAFLEQYGERAAYSRRAVAHSVIGDVAWRASCPDATLGLCIDELPRPATPGACVPPQRGIVVQRKRDATLANEAREHLAVTVGLADIEPPADETAKQQLATAIGRARVQMADADLESYLTLEPPTSFDLDHAKELSQEAFHLYYKRGSDEGMRLVKAYKDVKGSDPYWDMVAGTRTGMISETMSESLLVIPPPAGMDAEQHANYCAALEPYYGAPRQMAFDAYTWCVEKADANGLGDDPIAQRCRERAAALGPQE